MKRWLASAALFASAAWTSPLVAQDPPLAAELGCAIEPAPGRVVCRLDVEVSSGRLVWSDALVEKTPDFARPLRSRIGAREATQRGERRAELPVVFVAERLGKGTVEVVARAVVCRSDQGSEQCVALSRRVKATLEVGIARSAPR